MNHGGQPLLTNGVCAVVVTFHPQHQDLENLSALRVQVEGLVVVDNGSDMAELEQLRAGCLIESCELIENGENLGIAAALNVGVRWAKERGFEWVALFDQDSTVTDGFIAEMIADFVQYAKERKILQIIPRYRDPDSGVERVTDLDKDGGPFVTITSGSLFPMEAFDVCGYFKEELFIYCVDDDFSLRIRLHGYSIAESHRAILLHKSGHPSRHKLLWKTFISNNYSPISRYYGVRNRVWMMRTYGRVYPRLLVEGLRSCLVIPIKILVSEDQPLPKVAMVLRGMLDGILGRMGKLQ